MQAPYRSHNTIAHNDLVGFRINGIVTWGGHLGAPV
jgi:hypothetical protein